MVKKLEVHVRALAETCASNFGENVAALDALPRDDEVHRVVSVERDPPARVHDHHNVPETVELIA